MLGAMSSDGLEVRVARTAGELEGLRDAWDALPWEREEAELDHLLLRVRLKTDAVAPLGIVVRRDGVPVAGLAARVEERPLPAAVGYRVVYAPRVRLLHVIQGGTVAADPAARDALLGALRDVLGRGEVDVVSFPALPVDGELLAALRGLGGPLQLQRFGRTTARRRLVLPDTFEEYVASRSSNTRWRIHRDARRVPAALGELEVVTIRGPEQLEQLFRGAERVAAATYQRALGAGFSDTPEQRELALLGLERGWLRAYLLYRSGEPLAFWLCSTYRGTMLIRTTGFDQAYAEHRVGLFLLLRAIEDAIADPELRIVDFGQGDAAYKQQLAGESELERDLVVFAPTLRGLRINAVRTPILGGALLARRVLDAGGLTDRVRTGWRGRLRRPA
jgi:CelD/BcsL family acetyltransferase involved in cellulose biosynthesis